MGKKREKEMKKNKGRKSCCDKEAGLRRGSWSLEEDKILVDFITTNGHGTWRNLPKLAGLLRCGKSCRLRWVNYLQPGIKRDAFSPEEENTIIHLHHTLGNKWAAIASHLPGRTDNDIKNFWNTNLKKRLSTDGYTSNRNAVLEKGDRIEDKSNKATLLLNNLTDGNEDDRSHSLESQTSSSSSPVKMFNWIQASNDKEGGVLHCRNGAEDVAACSDDLNCDEFDDDSGDAILELLLNFPDESVDVGFLQGTDD